MRPKKKILLWGAGEIDLGILRVVLISKGFDVTTAPQSATQLTLASRLDVLVLVGLPQSRRDTIERRIYATGRKVRVVSIAGRDHMPEFGRVIELVERIRLATCRRRYRRFLMESRVA